MTENENDQQDWEVAAGEFGSRIASRHLGVAQRIAGRLKPPLRRISLAARGMPALARKVVEKTRWGDSIAGRVGMLSDHIRRSLQLTDIPTEQPRFVWHRREQLEEGSDVPFEEFIDESSILPEEERIAASPGQPAARPESGMTPAVQRKSSPQKTAEFVSRQRAKVQKPPTISLSEPMLESMGILPSEPLPSVAEEGIPLPFSEPRPLQRPGETGPVDRPTRLQRKPSAIEAETIRPPAPALPESEPAQPVDGEIEPQETGMPPVHTDEETIAEEVARPTSEKRLIAPKKPFTGIIARKPFEPVISREPAEATAFVPIEPQMRRPATVSDEATRIDETQEPVAREELPRADIPRTEIAEPVQLIHLEKLPVVPSTEAPGIQAETEAPPTAEAPAVPESEDERAISAEVESPPVTTPPDIPAELEAEAISEKEVPESAVPDLAAEITEKYRLEEVSSRPEAEQALPLAREPQKAQAGEERVPREEAEEPSREEFAGTIIEKYQPRETAPPSTIGPLPLVQRTLASEVTEEMTISGLARALRSKYIPEETEAQMEEISGDQLDQFEDGRSATGRPVSFEPARTISPTTGPGRAISRKREGRQPGREPAFISEGFPHVVSLGEAETISEIEYSPLREVSPGIIQGKFERPEMVLATSRDRFQREPVTEHIYRSAVDEVAAGTAIAGTEAGGETGEPQSEANPEEIARQVYAIIRRKLAVERERTGRR
jgi:hypothetical protein